MAEQMYQCIDCGNIFSAKEWNEMTRTHGREGTRTIEEIQDTDSNSYICPVCEEWKSYPEEITKLRRKEERITIEQFKVGDNVLINIDDGYYGVVVNVGTERILAEYVSGGRIVEGVINKDSLTKLK